MAGVEIDRLQRMRHLAVDARRLDEIQRVADPVGHVAVFRGLLAFGEAQCPAMDLMHIRIAAGRERAQQVQRGGRLQIGLQHALRVGLARLWRGGQIVDDVTTVRRQFHPVDHFGRGRTRLGELAGHAAHLDHRHLGAIGQHHRHLQHHLERVADCVGAELVEAFRAIAALQQKRLAARRLAKCGFQLARLAGKDQRGIFGQLRLDGAKAGGIQIIRHLNPWASAPIGFLPFAHVRISANLLLSGLLYKSRAPHATSDLPPHR